MAGEYTVHVTVLADRNSGPANPSPEPRALATAAIALLWIATAAGCAQGGVPDRRAGALDRDAIAELRVLCPSPLETMSAECALALERRYASKPFTARGPGIGGGWGYVYRRTHADVGMLLDPVSGRWWLPAPRQRRVGWAELFADAPSTRSRVEAAVQRPECLVPEGTTRHDLRESCDAEAMFRLALLMEACLTPRFSRGAAGWRDRWDWLLDRVVEDWGGDGAVEDTVWDYRLHFAWRRGRCQEVPVGVFRMMRELPLPTVGSGQGRWLDVLAARLGDVWAHATWGRGEADVNAAVDADPVVGYVGRARRALVEGTVVEALAFLLAAQRLDAQRSESVFDWRGLRSAFTNEEVEVAAGFAERILAFGVGPLPEPEYSHGSSRGHRHWIDAEGRERWGSAHGTVIVTSGGFLPRCGRRGKQHGHLPQVRRSYDYTLPDWSVLAPVGLAEEVAALSSDEVRRWIGSDGRECALAADGTVMPAVTDWHDDLPAAVESGAERRQGDLREIARRLRAEMVGDPDVPAGGDLDGAVTVIVFHNYRCGNTRASSAAVEAALEIPGVRVEFRDHPIPGLARAARLAQAAHVQGRYLDARAALTEWSGNVGADDVPERLAAKLGLDAGRLREDLASPEVGIRLAANRWLAEWFGVKATPTFVFLGPDAVERFAGGIDATKMKRIIRSVM